MAASKKIDRIDSFRKNVKIAGKWVGKMRKKGKIRKSDLEKLNTLKKRQIDEADKRWSKLTDEMEQARRHEAEFIDRMTTEYGQESSSSDEEDMEEPNDPLSKRIKNEPESDNDHVPGDELEAKFSNANFSSADRVKREAEDDEHYFTPLPQKISGTLPKRLKTSDGDRDSNDDADMDFEHDQLNSDQETIDEKDKKSVENLDQMSVPKLYASRAEIVKDYKHRIATNALMIIENPQLHVHKLKLLTEMARGVDVHQLAVISVQKLATASLLEIFLDIIPSYHIREWTEEEEKQKMTKETRSLHEFEQALLRNYGKYIKHLSALCKCSANNKLYKSILSPNVARSCQLLGVKSASRLLSDHFHFNFRVQLLEALVPCMNDKDDNVRSIACSAIESIFSSDKLGEASFDAVRSICKFIKNNTRLCRPCVLRTFLHLRIKQVEKKEEKARTKRDILAKKQKIKLMSRKERKMHKRLKKLDEELRDLEAEENQVTVLKFHTRIMEQVFAVYFRLLKRRLPGSSGGRLKLLGPVLEGLSKFAHLINVEFFDDLIRSLLDLVHAGGIGIVNSLHCVKTAFVILAGEGQALNIDPYGFYKFLYYALTRIANEKNKDLRKSQLRLALECLDLMIIKRRKQVPLARVAAFVKRLTLLAAKFDHNEIISILLSIKSMFVAHPKLEMLIDEENAQVGSGIYLVNSDDPDRSNAQSTSIIDELKKLQDLNNKDIRKLSLHIKNGLPCNGPFSIGVELSSRIPWTFD